MITFPNAKINLGLHIVSKREDGFHNIESCFYPIPVHDVLEIIDADEFYFQPSGLEIPGNLSSNLCLKAYELLEKKHKLKPINIRLHKVIPVGAGLGGGSADGSFILKMLNSHFQLDLNSEKLRYYALQLGSDCPFFIDNLPSIASGRGEQLKIADLDLSGYWLALHDPGIHISTHETYEGITPQTPEQEISSIIAQPVSHWKDHLINDFEATIFDRYPSINAIKKGMYASGALYASMTGTGSTVIGIFEEKPDNKEWIVCKL